MVLFLTIFLLLQSQTPGNANTPIVSNKEPTNEDSNSSNKDKIFVKGNQSLLEVEDIRYVDTRVSLDYGEMGIPYTRFKFTWLDPKTGKPKRSKRFERKGHWVTLRYNSTGQRYILIESADLEMEYSGSMIAYFLEKEGYWVYSNYDRWDRLIKSVETESSDHRYVVLQVFDGSESRLDIIDVLADQWKTVPGSQCKDSESCPDFYNIAKLNFSEDGRGLILVTGDKDPSQRQHTHFYDLSGLHWNKKK